MNRDTSNGAKLSSPLTAIPHPPLSLTASEVLSAISRAENDLLDLDEKCEEILRRLHRVAGKNDASDG